MATAAAAPKTRHRRQITRRGSGQYVAYCVHCDQFLGSHYTREVAEAAYRQHTGR